MSIQLSVAVSNARLDQIETTISTAPKLRIMTGPPPADCAAADTGTLLVEMSLPSDWLAAAANRLKAKTGTWSGTAGATGTAGHFRIKDTAGTNTHIQGTITATGFGGDITMPSISITTSQVVTINNFTLNDDNA